METHKVDGGGQNEVSGERWKEGSFSDLFWGTETSASLSAEHNGGQNPVNPFLASLEIEATSSPRNPFFSTPESKLNGFTHSSTTLDPFSTQRTDFNTSTSDENKLPRKNDLSTIQNNDWFLASVSSTTIHAPLKTDFSPIPAENGWAAFPHSAVSQEVKSQQMTSTNHMEDIFQFTPTSWPSEQLHTGSSKQKTDIFQPYSAKESMAANERTEHTKSSNERDHLLEYLLSKQQNNNLLSASPPTTVSSWQSDVFVPPPIITTDLFQTPEGFTGTPTSVSTDIFQTPLSSVENGGLQNTTLYQTPSTMPVEIKAFDPLSDNSAVKSQESRYNAHLTPGTGGIFQESPSVMPRPHSLADGGLMFKRRMLKPVPRIKIYKSPNQAMYAHTWSTPPAPSPTSAAQASPIPTQPWPLSPTPDPLSPTPDPLSPTPAPLSPTLDPLSPTPAPPTVVPRGKINGTAQPEKNDMQVYEDVLFIGQERCVEDWPEDSPELSPDWKPAGKLKLRKDSLRISPSELEGSPTNSLGKKNGKLKLGKKLRSSILSRRESKNKLGDDLKLSETDTVSKELKESATESINGAYGSPLSWEPKSHNCTVDDVFSSDQDEQSTAMDHKSEKKKKYKIAVPHLHYRMSKTKLRNEGLENGIGHATPQHVTKEDLLEGKGSVQIDEDIWNAKEKLQELRDCRPKEPLKLKHSVQHQPSKDPFEDDPKNDLKMKDLQFLDQPKGSFLDEEEGVAGFTPSWESKAGYLDEVFTQKGTDDPMTLHSSGKTKETQARQPKKPVKLKVSRLSWKGSKDTMAKTDSENNHSFDILGSSYNEEEGASGYTPSWRPKNEVFYNDTLTPLDSEGTQELEVTRPKKHVKIRVPRLPRKGSKNIADAEFQQKDADLYKASDMTYSEIKKPPILRVPQQSCSDSKEIEDELTPAKGVDLLKAGEWEDSWISTEEYTPETKPQKKSQKVSKESKAKDQDGFPEDLGPIGATSGDYYLSEAAKAEWRSSQIDVWRSKEPEDEQHLEAVDEEEEGDTDSLMEWWNTVELWDEVPSDEEISLKEDETKSFTDIAGKVHRGLRVFYKSFTEQAEVLYQHVIFLYAIADDLSNFHRRAKFANIAGGTTTAVGGVAAIAGLALAPVTFGTSLIVSAVGLGVATAGGITAASAAISDNVNDTSDRKKIELIVEDYETRLTELQRCLRFVTEGIRRLRCHPLLRRNNYYAGDWEVRRALQTVSLVTEPVERAEEIVNGAMVALNNECKGMDKYFVKDSRELKRGCKKELTARVRLLAKQLHDGLVELNSIREQLLDATGHV